MDKNNQSVGRRRGFFGPMMVILLGMVLLLKNLGLLPYSFGFLVWKLWPLAIIFVGLHAVFRNSTRDWLVYLFGLIVALSAFYLALSFLGGWHLFGVNRSPFGSYHPPMLNRY